MLSFKFFILNEIAELQKPISRIEKSSIKKDAGTWKERPVIQYKFTTSQGNEVKIHFEKKEENTYDVMFYVNDTQHDNASANQENIRDTEILGNVLWVVKQKCDKLKINTLTFTAQTGQGDTKNIKNLDINKYKIIFLNQLNQLEEIINNYQVKMIEPNYSLFKKLNRIPPPPRPDVNKDLFNKIFKAIKQLLQNNESLEEIINNNYHHFENLKTVGIDTKAFLQSIKNLNNAIQSNSPSGWKRHINRREILWEKLFKKYFPNWNMSKYGTKFTLTKM